ncbi:Hypothetical_protein [Hexamita inflata]|uniref:Hypothetical_protein n=1 Tax=Hexamita inflata TaxID=28002 RepID=A0AA86R4U4_9EUKA|nr:Hypothetical protein HINF_LOCUS49945 [Hexamita inflata]
MKRKLVTNWSSHKLETIQEQNDEQSNGGIISRWDVNRTTSKSSLNQISFITNKFCSLNQFVCLTEENFYDISCTLEYLEFCESKLNAELSSLNKRAQKCLKQAVHSLNFCSKTGIK